MWIFDGQCVCTRTVKSVFTKEDEQTHADGEDGAGAECSQAQSFNLSQFTPLAPEALRTAALEAFGGVGQACASIPACGGATRGRGALHQPRHLISNSKLTSWTPAFTYSNNAKLL